MSRLRLYLLALLLWTFGAAGGALAQSCTLSVTPLSFGAVDVTANAQVDSTATATVSCTGALLPVGVCIEIGPGSGGGSNAANRLMKSGSNQLGYGLYSNAAATTPWGSGAWPGGAAAPVGFNITPSGGAGSQSVTIYGRVPGGQPTTAPASYASSFAGQDIRIRYGLLSFLLGCDLLTIIQTASFTVSATVPTTCRITANALNFGGTGTLATQLDASTVISPTCTSGTPYQIGLNGGLSGATNPTQRRMAKGAESVVYGLYRNSGRTLPFGQTLTVDTLGGSGSGLAQPLSVHGRVAAQPTPSAGVYSDTVVATVTY